MPTATSMMAPPHNLSAGRRSTDTSMSGGAPQGPGRENSAYSQQSQLSGTTANGSRYGDQPLTPNMTGNNYRGGPPQQLHPSSQNVGDVGRNTPPPLKSGTGLSEADVQAILNDHDTLQGKYRKVKGLYFERNNQIDTLQNTLASLRMGLSRTSLDDTEYVNRFNRLDGAITQTAFNIRQSWKSIPPWLQPSINQGAQQKSNKEMTIVGRACISRWILDEIFNRYFHPALARQSSERLKEIEQNIRRLSPQPTSLEESEALIAKISSWRMTTIDALRDSLHGDMANDEKMRLADHLSQKLEGSLMMHLAEPVPPGLGDGVRMIIDLAVSILSNIPQESREIRIEYFLPLSSVQENLMMVDWSLPALVNPHISPETDNLGSREKDENSEEGREENLTNGNKEGDKKKQSSGIIRTFRDKLAHPQGDRSGPVSPLPPEAHQSALNRSRENSRDGLVRVAAFLAVEVRGRAVLYKTPVSLFGSPPAELA